MLCNYVFAKDFNYTCVLDMQYQVSDNKKWHNKKIKFNIYNSGNIIKIFNKNILLERFVGGEIFLIFYLCNFCPNLIQITFRQ